MYLKNEGIGSQIANNHVTSPKEIGAQAVHLVHEADTWDAVFISLTPNGFRLGLHSSHTVKQADCPIKHSQRSLHLQREVDVAGSVDDVDTMVFPLGRGSSRRNCDSSLLLLTIQKRAFR